MAEERYVTKEEAEDRIREVLAPYRDRWSSQLGIIELFMYMFRNGPIDDLLATAFKDISPLSARGKVSVFDLKKKLEIYEKMAKEITKWDREDEGVDYLNS